MNVQVEMMSIEPNETLNEFESLRAQALDLYDRCITRGTPELLLAFIEEQISHKPPRISVLGDIADYLHMRLIALREQYFEARDRVLHIIRVRFDLDLSPLLAPKPEFYHTLPIDDLINAICHQKPLSVEDEIRLRRILKVSHAIAAQVYTDAEMTEQLYNFITDWLRALNTQSARPAMHELHPPSERLH